MARLGVDDEPGRLQRGLELLERLAGMQHLIAGASTDDVMASVGVELAHGLASGSDLVADHVGALVLEDRASWEREAPFRLLGGEKPSERIDARPGRGLIRLGGRGGRGRAGFRGRDWSGGSGRIEEGNLGGLLAACGREEAGRQDQEGCTHQSKISAHEMGVSAVLGFLRV